MQKRKRSAYDDGGDRVQNMRKQDAQDVLAKARKQLHRALKTAKGFERQKLGKRLKFATTNGQSEDIARINREIKALKGLDLESVTNAHLYKSLLKIKAFAESENLPDQVKTELPKPNGDDVTVAAWRNVTSGMFNMKQVKETMAQIVNEMYIAMGIPALLKRENGMKKVEVKGILKNDGLGLSRRVDDADLDVDQKGEPGIGDSELPWESFDSREEEEDKQENQGDTGDESIDEEELSRYDALIGVSSDEQSFDEEKDARNRPPQSTVRLSLSLSPTPSESPTPPPSPSLPPSSEPEPTKVPKTSKPKASQTAKPALSTFLPTLMGGYWSGSESSASDLEDAAPIKKNRPGQMARRAIWEKKYGDKANHIKTVKGPVGKGKDDGWDAKKGAKDTSGGRGRGGFRGGGGRVGIASGRTRNYERATGENAVAVEPKKRGMGKKDDVGVLHPSWQAAKKAKEAKKTATFQGKKVTFD
jgi:hypothetical protein